MLKRIAGLIAAGCLAACSIAPIVYDPKDGPDAPASGSVRPLKDLLPASTTKAWLVFVHGVGDHCEGYALDRENGWLSDKVMAQIGMRARSDVVPPAFVNVNVFMGGPADARSGVWYSSRDLTWKVPGRVQDVEVRAVEVTWSPMTQWLKSNQLGYDSPSTTPLPGASKKDCTEAPDVGIATTKEPPARLLLDRVIKEFVFDRNLSDAILYSGSYGAAIERGVAEALCHALTGTAPESQCTWPSASTWPDPSHKFFFVTHSLGSRIVYDALLNLQGYATDARPNPFCEGEVDGSKPAIGRLLASTQAFYMMANQLALLGLANVPKEARSGTGLHPYALPLYKLATAPVSAAEGDPPVFGNVFGLLGELRAKGLTEQAPLQIVSFNDTNDLLTWHVPPWYESKEMSADRRPRVEVVNVFVRNQWPLLFLESPAPAHSGYFSSGSVWRVIACGANDGHALDCL